MLEIRKLTGRINYSVKTEKENVRRDEDEKTDKRGKAVKEEKHFESA